MIEFTQVKEGEPPYDVRVQTNDSDGELAYLDDDFITGEATDTQAYKNLTQTSPDEGGTFTFVIPGEEVGSVADIFELSECDAIANFGTFMEAWNTQLIEETMQAMPGEE